MDFGRNSNNLRIITLILIIVLLCQLSFGKVIYVDDDAIGANIGSNWTNAIIYLQDALLLAYFYDKPVEIRVAQGIYTPDKGVGIAPGDRDASFQLINGVTIKGGYAGVSERDPNVRDIKLYKTILSGDLNQDDGADFTNNSENSYHVVTGSGTDGSAIFDGCTVTAGNSHRPRSSGRRSPSPSLIDQGGGMYNNYGSPSIINCTFMENSAGYGGGMYNFLSNPNILNCIFTGNSAISEGGAIYNDMSSPKLTNCTFSENSGQDGGGGMFNQNSSPMLADCNFIGNSTETQGGGMHNLYSSPVLLSCIFSENSANTTGGGIYNVSSAPVLTNCIFRENSARLNGSGICNDYSIFPRINTGEMLLRNCTFYGNVTERGGWAFYQYNSGNSWPSEFYPPENRQTTLINCIFWGNIPEEINSIQSIWSPGREGLELNLEVIFCNVRGGFPGQGNINIDPQFVDPNNGDFHLKSQAGRWDTASETWVIDTISSPCIDAGDPNTPIASERFPNGDRINIGAYGGTTEASLSPLWLIPDSPGKAFNPYPTDGAVGAEINPTLSWSSGDYAIAHDVYFGTNYDNVNNATVTNPLDVLVSEAQVSTNYTPGTLGYNRTYFWRIDEIDAYDNKTKGDIWLFTTTSGVKGRTCFLPNTPVWADGEFVPISTVAAGQIAGALNTAIVEKLQEHVGMYECRDVILENGNCISVVESHLFMLESGMWISSKNLQSGMKLKTMNGAITIESVRKREMPYVGKVYNLKVSGTHQYMVGEDAVIVRDY